MVVWLLSSMHVDARRLSRTVKSKSVRTKHTGLDYISLMQASGGGCSGLPQPTMNIACGCGRRCGGLRRSESAAEHFFIWIAYP
jgi:hypothetical protein